MDSFVLNAILIAVAVIVVFSLLVLGPAVHMPRRGSGARRGRSDDGAVALWSGGVDIGGHAGGHGGSHCDAGGHGGGCDGGGGGH